MAYRLGVSVRSYEQSDFVNSDPGPHVLISHSVLALVTIPPY